MTWSELRSLVNGFANTTLFTLAGTPVTAVSILTFVLILLVSAWMSRVAQRIVDRWLRTRGVLEEGTISTSKRLLHYGVILVGLGVALQTIGINLGALFAAGSGGGGGHRFRYAEHPPELCFRAHSAGRDGPSRSRTSCMSMERS